MLASAALDPPASHAPSDTSSVRFGVGIDTSCYGHHACFLRDDLQPAADELAFAESANGYSRLRGRLEQLARRHPTAAFAIRIAIAIGHAMRKLLHLAF